MIVEKCKNLYIECLNYSIKKNVTICYNRNRVKVCVIMPVIIWSCSSDDGFTTYEPDKYDYKCPYCE